MPKPDISILLQPDITILLRHKYRNIVDTLAYNQINYQMIISPILVIWQEYSGCPRILLLT